MRLGHNRGNAMIYALVVVMILSIMLTIIVNISNYERRVTKSYRDYANLYDMAVSGVENALALFNNELDVNLPEILDQTITELNAYDITSIVEYVNTDANVYGGDFYIKNSSSGFAAAFAKSSNNVVKEKLYAGGNLHFEFVIQISSSGMYRIVVDVSDGGNNTHNVTSVVYMDQIEASATVKAVIAITGENSGQEEVIPQLGWNSTPFWAYNVINALTPYSNFHEAAIPYYMDWESRNPLLVISDSGISVKDTSMFYNGDKAVSSVIISKSDGLRLTAHDYLKNEYRGIIYSAGDVYIDGVNFTGSIISTGEINISSGSAVSPNELILFEPKFSNKILKHRVYDFFRATKFYEIGNVFSAAKITGFDGFIVENMGSVNYFIKSLIRVY